MIGNIPTTGTYINDLLGRFGIAGGQIGAAIDAMAGNPLGMLQNLRDAYHEAATGHATTGSQRELFDKMGGSFVVPPPLSVLPAIAPLIGPGYFLPTPVVSQVDLAPGASDKKLLGLYLNGNRANAANFERALRQNPALRAMAEAALGGSIVFDGKNDGKLTVMRFARALVPGAAAAGALFPTAAAAMGWISNIANAMGGLKSDALMQLIGGGLANIGDGLGVKPSEASQASEAPSGSFQQQCSDVLADNSMTIEDKVVMFLMLIMNKMDKDIEGQMKEINDLQQKQKQEAKKGGGLGGFLKSILPAVGGIAGTAFGGPLGSAIGGLAGNLLGGILGGGGAGGDGDGRSIDVETMKLKRMIDKRSQMFDMLRQIIDKYNETAKNMIRSIGR